MLMSKGINWNDYPIFFKRGTYARRETFEIRLPKDEIEKLPPKHECRANPEKLIIRSEIRLIDMPIFSKVLNREEVIFEGAVPRTAEI